MTHGVTERTSNLVYWGQSGAINESISDIFGEIIDHRNVGPRRHADQLAASARILRSARSANIANPPAFGDPDRTGSPLYVKETCAAAATPTTTTVSTPTPASATRRSTWPRRAARSTARRSPASTPATTLTKSGQALAARRPAADVRAATTPTWASSLNQACHTLCSGTGVIHRGQLHGGRTRRRSRPSCAATPAQQPAAGGRHGHLPGRRRAAGALRQRDRHAGDQVHVAGPRLVPQRGAADSGQVAHSGTGRLVQRESRPPARRPWPRQRRSRSRPDRRRTCTSTSGGCSTTSTQQLLRRRDGRDQRDAARARRCRGSTGPARRSSAPQPGRRPAGLRRGQPGLPGQPTRPDVVRRRRTSSRSSR